MLWASVGFGAISAVLWLGAAIIPPAVVGSYWDGPPPNVRRRLRVGAFCNTAAALSAALAMGCQAAATWATLI